MTATSISRRYNLTGITNANACNYLYAAFDMAQEADPAVITDRSGNGHNLIWLGGVNNPDSPPVGYRASDHIHLPEPMDNNDVFVATSPDFFMFSDLAQSSLYIVRMKDASPALAAANIIGKRGALAGPTDAGFQIQRNAGGDFQLSVHDGTSFVTFISPSTTNIPTNEICTLLAAHDAPTHTWTIAVASDTTYRQFELSSTVNAAETNALASLQTMAIGQRSAELESEPYSDLYLYEFHAYHDPTGGPLPSDLGALCRMLHHNPGLYIPKGIWP